MAVYGFSRPRAGDPWALDQLRREIDQLFGTFGGRAATGERSGVYPAVNLYQTGDGYVLTADLPGLDRKDIEVSVEGNHVTLRGERRIEAPEPERASVHRRERQTGFFRRTVELPLPVDPEKTEAIYRHGVLMVRLPKSPEHRPRQISVTSS